MSENFHKVARERAILRNAEHQSGDLPPNTSQKVVDELEKINELAKKFSKDKFPTLSEAKDRLKTDRREAEHSAWLDENSIKKEMGDKYAELEDLEDKLITLNNFEMQSLRQAQQDPAARKVYERISETLQSEKSQLTLTLDKGREDNPTVARALDLVEYKRGLHEEGHIAPVPSVREHLRDIETRMISGLPMFIHGPTGGGKTSLARYAAKTLTGQDAEMLYCNPQTRESAIWGRQGITLEKGQPVTVDIFGPLARAMREGRVCIFDEFTALPKEQMAGIKGTMGYKPGDEVNVPGNGKVKIAPGFQMIFTANLKSEKNPERQELPPEVIDEFSQNNLEVSYVSPHESYDIMLARLMNPDGSVDLSSYDLENTLPNLCRAMEEIQTGYTKKLSDSSAKLTGNMNAAGKKAGLEKLTFSQRGPAAIIDGWKIERERGGSSSFVEYLDARLATMLTFKEFPEKDRVLAAKLLALHGLLRTLTATDLGLPADTFSFEASKKLRSSEKITEIKEKSKEIKSTPLSELVALDPFNSKQEEAIKIASAFIKPEHDTVASTSEELASKHNPFLKEVFKSWGIDQNKIDAAKIEPFLAPLDTIDYSQKKDDIDQAKFGEYTLNPETQAIDWENIPPEKIKTIDLGASWVGKPLQEVAKHIIDTYSATHYIPGIEYWQYLSENPNKIPPDLKDGNYHFFFGSLVRSSGGHWDVPCACWRGGEWDRRGLWLGRGWSALYRVVLLEK